MPGVTIIDLSVPTESSPSEALSPAITHQLHSESAAEMAKLFGCAESDLPDGLGWANDRIKIHAHAGTHVDAPWHYFPTSEGKKARTIDEMPIDWFYGDGVILDLRHKPSGLAATVADLKEALNKISYEIKPRDIVLIQTGADKYWGKPEYLDTGCGMTGESTLWLIEQGVRVMGIDAWGWDRPFSAIKEQFTMTGDKSILWEAHRAGMEREYCHIEKLANLDKLPRPFGFKVACFPVKLAGGSGGWCRAIAVVQE